MPATGSRSSLSAGSALERGTPRPIPVRGRRRAGASRSRGPRLASRSPPVKRSAGINPQGACPFVRQQTFVVSGLARCCSDKWGTTTPLRPAQLRPRPKPRQQSPRSPPPRIEQVRRWFSHRRRTAARPAIGIYAPFRFPMRRRHPSACVSWNRGCLDKVNTLSGHCGSPWVRRKNAESTPTGVVPGMMGWTAPRTASACRDGRCRNPI